MAYVFINTYEIAVKKFQFVHELENAYEIFENKHPEECLKTGNLFLFHLRFLNFKEKKTNS